MGRWHEVNAFSGCFGLVIVSLFEAVVNALFVEVAKMLLIVGFCKPLGNRVAEVNN